MVPSLIAVLPGAGLSTSTYALAGFSLRYTSYICHPGILALVQLLSKELWESTLSALFSKLEPFVRESWPSLSAASYMIGTVPGSSVHSSVQAYVSFRSVYNKNSPSLLLSNAECSLSSTCAAKKWSSCSLK